MSDEVGVLYLATDLRPGTASPDPTEDLAVRWATLDEVLAEIDAGEIHDLMTIAGVTRYALEPPAPGEDGRTATSRTRSPSRGR